MVITERERIRALQRNICRMEERPIVTFSISIVRPYSLRTSLEEKAADVCKYTSWTAFVNKAGTLIHVVHRDGGFHIRIPLYCAMKNVNEAYLLKFLEHYLYGKLV